MKRTLLCSALLAFGLFSLTSTYAQTTRPTDGGEMSAMEEFDWETEVETDMDLGEDGIPPGFDLMVDEALQVVAEEEEDVLDEESLEADDLLNLAAEASNEVADLSYGSVDPLTVEFFEDFETYFDNFDGTEWTDDLLADDAAEEESDLMEEELKPLKEAIENIEFQLEADWDDYSKDQPSAVSVDF